MRNVQCQCAQGTYFWNVAIYTVIQIFTPDEVLHICKFHEGNTCIVGAPAVTREP